MCGILGAAAERDVVQLLLESLQRLEYRGYDSAGIAIINPDHQIERLRSVGKVARLAEALSTQKLSGQTGIAHTRWATHGIPHQDNAHPHMSNDSLALVHNGIIENYEALREELVERGYQFSSETDSEVAAHLLHHHTTLQPSFLLALQATLKELSGAYALAIIDKNQPDTVWAVRKGSPLVIGIGNKEHFIASDQLALLPFTQQFVYLEEGDIAIINTDSYRLFDTEGTKVTRPVHQSVLNYEIAERGKYRHFMLKEIHEQPAVLQNSLASILDAKQFKPFAFGTAVEQLLSCTKRILIIACGTSYNAGLVAKYWLEDLSKLPCHVEIASEYRYRNPVVEADTLFITLSQSGETADTLACLRLAKTLPYLGTLAICNVAQSSLVRESDAAILTYAGPEIGVASTKAFLTQLSTLLALTLYSAQLNHLVIPSLKDFVHLPTLIEHLLSLDGVIQKLAKRFVNKHSVLYLGRNTEYPIALEGALKLKELSYIHAEAYPAGELKHGPLALVDEQMPVIVLAADNALFDKVKSNIQEVKARGGDVIIFTNQPSEWQVEAEIIHLPSSPAYLAPFVFTVPLQLLAYHVAVLKGTDVDQPRNLAKSVTVE